MNCAFKSSIYPKINQPAIIGPDLMRLFCDIHSEFDRYDFADSAIILSSI